MQRYDGYESAILGARMLQGVTAMSHAQQYATGGLYGRVIDMPADKAVERGVEIEGDDGKIDDELDRLNVMSALCDALRWAQLYGGAGIVVLADDGMLNEPLNPERIGQVEELRVFSLAEISVDGEKYADPTQRNYGMPIYYRVASGNAQFRVHESRLIEVSGDRLPTAMQMRGIPWEGRSVAKRAYPAIDHYLESQVLAVNILRRKQQAIYSMEGLGDAVAAGQESLVQKRINLVDQVRGILNTVAIDGKDTYDIRDMNLAGIKEVMQEFQVALAAEVGIPVTILFGRSPGGLNATGDADFDGYHEMVAQLQRTRLTPALERIVSILYAQRGMAAPESWTIKWNPLSTPTEKEAAEMRKTNADAEAQEMQALMLAAGTGAVSEDEAHDYMQQRGMFGLVPDQTTNTGYANET